MLEKLIHQKQDKLPKDSKVPKKNANFNEYLKEVDRKIELLEITLNQNTQNPAINKRDSLRISDDDICLLNEESSLLSTLNNLQSPLDGHQEFDFDKYFRQYGGSANTDSIRNIDAFDKQLQLNQPIQKENMLAQQNVHNQSRGLIPASNNHIIYSNQNGNNQSQVQTIPININKTESPRTTGNFNYNKQFIEVGDISEIAEAMEEEEDNESQYIDKKRQIIKSRLISGDCSVIQNSDIQSHLSSVILQHASNYQGLEEEEDERKERKTSLTISQQNRCQQDSSLYRRNSLKEDFILFIENEEDIKIIDIKQTQYQSHFPGIQNAQQSQSGISASEIDLASSNQSQYYSNQERMQKYSPQYVRLIKPKRRGFQLLKQYLLAYFQGWKVRRIMRSDQIQRQIRVFKVQLKLIKNKMDYLKLDRIRDQILIQFGVIFKSKNWLCLVTNSIKGNKPEAKQIQQTKQQQIVDIKFKIIPTSRQKPALNQPRLHLKQSQQKFQMDLQQKSQKILQKLESFTKQQQDLNQIANLKKGDNLNSRNKGQKSVLQPSSTSYNLLNAKPTSIVAKHSQSQIKITLKHPTQSVIQQQTTSSLISVNQTKLDLGRKRSPNTRISDNFHQKRQLGSNNKCQTSRNNIDNLAISLKQQDASQQFEQFYDQETSSILKNYVTQDNRSITRFDQQEYNMSLLYKQTGNILQRSSRSPQPFQRGEISKTDYFSQSKKSLTNLQNQKQQQNATSQPIVENQRKPRKAKVNFIRRNLTQRNIIGRIVKDRSPAPPSRNKLLEDKSFQNLRRMSKGFLSERPTSDDETDRGDISNTREIQRTMIYTTDAASEFDLKKRLSHCNIANGTSFDGESNSSLVQLKSLDLINDFVNKMGNNMASQKCELKNDLLTKSRCDQEFESLINGLRMEYQQIFSKQPQSLSLSHQQNKNSHR